MKPIPHKLTDNVKLLQKVALIAGDSVLVLRRGLNETSRPNNWDLPGGNSEWPTDGAAHGWGQLRADAIREVEEETLISLQTNQFAESNITFLDSFYDSAKDVFSLVVGWRLELADRPLNIVLSSEHLEFRWVELAEIDELDFGGQRGEFVKEIVRRALR